MGTLTLRRFARKVQAFETALEAEVFRRHLKRDDFEVLVLTQSKRRLDNFVLKIASPGVTTRIAQREIGEQEPRHTTMLDDIARRADDNCRNTIGLEMPCDQTHGLVTHGSKRTDQRGIGSIFAQAIQDIRCVDLDGLALTVFGRHAMKARGQF